MIIENLIKLRKHLKKIDPATFDMTLFSHEPTTLKFIDVGEANEVNWCGTAACILGHATAIFPFEVGDLKSCGEIDWVKYSERVFGDSFKSNELWSFIFASYWENSIEKAIQRINYVLEKGRPPINYGKWTSYGMNEAMAPRHLTS